jgi:hypothetical protein
MMRDEGVWWSLQPFLQDEDSNPYPDPARRASQSAWPKARSTL